MYQLTLIPLLICIFTITSAAQEQPVSLESIRVYSFCSLYSRLYGCCWLEPRPGKGVALSREMPDDGSRNGDHISKIYDVQQLLGEE